MRGHTKYASGIAHLPGRQCIITCSVDGSLRLCHVESSEQIGDKWRDEGDEAGVRTMALFPNGMTLVSGSSDGTVRLWDVEMGKVVLKWKGHTECVTSVCWSRNGEQVVSGDIHGTVRVWDVKNGEPIQGMNPIKTGHEFVYAASYSPEAKTIATGGYNKSGIEIWDAKTGKQIAVLEHTSAVYSVTLFQNDCLLASTSWDGTARLWNLDTNIQVGPPLQHENFIRCAAFSADGKLLSTVCDDNNVYVWDIHAILNTAGLGDLNVSVHAPSTVSLI
ncbi:hypothetical protein CY34DRAFT_99902 [Suillus luteus UH-Slu-Lm8-n1]|uniref:WD40 repeat-like protein n=1 Tax=Suillus luteus UH-Slu-Lm8-n1 TaxID=930992 RepID=A0A0C9ZV31_9AGAM|nr:hypothetical protein CY34DRAFT_99902 [Suillus luteus UH-Slu-Lm8-n1]